MPDRPQISVVIPSRNRAHVLPRAVESVLAQSERDFELVIVDDASSDGTDRYLGSLADPRVRVVANALRLGAGGGRNRGLAEARADIVAFLDSDDAYRPNYLATALAVFAREPDAVATLASSIHRMRSKTHETHLPDIALSAAVSEWALLCQLFPVTASAIAVRRADALAIGGFNDSLRQWEDREFLIRLAPRGSIRLMPYVLWEKFWSEDGLSNPQADLGGGLVAYADTAFGARYPKLRSYLATQVLMADLRHGLWAAFLRDRRAFRAAGLISGGPLAVWRNHREVRRYRRRNASREALASLSVPPHTW